VPSPNRIWSPPLSLLNLSATCSLFLFRKLSPLTISVPKSRYTYPFRDVSVMLPTTAHGAGRRIPQGWSQFVTVTLYPTVRTVSADGHT
jgi:hypothetical protein